MKPIEQKSEAFEDETDITEITLQTDGRVYVFGMSRDVLEILAGLDPASQRLQALLGRRPQVDLKALKS